MGPKRKTNSVYLEKAAIYIYVPITIHIESGEKRQISDSSSESSVETDSDHEDETPSESGHREKAPKDSGHKTKTSVKKACRSSERYTRGRQAKKTVTAVKTEAPLVSVRATASQTVAPERAAEDGTANEPKPKETTKKQTSSTLVSPSTNSKPTETKSGMGSWGCSIG
ncbi:uncharacterized protein LOC106057484 [Biomphalaria glabrata]|uniref:Uncharacterized protein LOC106057484 n=1 Tax=Biomphalaria glabrata TaxID=6526 RepID=A0A9W3AJB8_BIOGL|nr:uncharacterized protein LOC106057484 [Biomphalaria glabrata]